MWADGSEGDCVSTWVDDGSTTGQVVSCASSGSRDQYSITLHDGEESVVDVDIESAHELCIASGDGDLVEGVADGGLDLLLSVTVHEHSLE